LTLIEWESLETLRASATHPEHVPVKQIGREKFHEDYRLQICEVVRESNVQAQGGAGSADGRRLLNGRARPSRSGARRLPGPTFDTLAQARLPTLGARAGMSKRAGSTLRGVASGRTGVRPSGHGSSISSLPSGP